MNLDQLLNKYVANNVFINASEQEAKFLSNFGERKYSLLDSEQKLKLLNDFMDLYCQKCGINQSPVLGIKRIESEAEYRSNLININIGEFNNLTGLEILSTLSHELRHYYQEKVSLGEIIDDENFELFRANRRVYIYPSQLNIYDYLMQPNEIDAYLTGMATSIIVSKLINENNELNDNFFKSLKLAYKDKDFDDLNTKFMMKADVFMIRNVLFLENFTLRNSKFFHRVYKNELFEIASSCNYKHIVASNLEIFYQSMANYFAEELAIKPIDVRIGKDLFAHKEMLVLTKEDVLLKFDENGVSSVYKNIEQIFERSMVDFIKNMFSNKEQKMIENKDIIMKAREEYYRKLVLPIAQKIAETTLSLTEQKGMLNLINEKNEIVNKIEKSIKR